MTKPIVGEIYIYKGEEYIYTEDCDKLQKVPYFELYVEKDKQITRIPNGSYKTNYWYL